MGTIAVTKFETQTHEMAVEWSCGCTWRVRCAKHVEMVQSLHDLYFASGQDQAWDKAVDAMFRESDGGTDGWTAVRDSTPNAVEAMYAAVQQTHDTDERHERRTRRALQRMGLALRKSRRDIPGGYMIVDPTRNTIVLGDVNDGYGLSMRDVVKFIKTQ